MDRLALLYRSFLTVPSFVCYSASPTSETYTLSLHDALPICSWSGHATGSAAGPGRRNPHNAGRGPPRSESVRLSRSEEHTSELQSLTNLVCRLLLEKKKSKKRVKWKEVFNMLRRRMGLETAV